MRHIFSASALALFVSFSGVSHAQEQAPGSGPSPFSDCGIGAALFPDIHWAAVLSNVIWDIGTTAVTSATASPETCNGAGAKTAQFIFDNYDRLNEETASGGGEHTLAMMNSLGCPSEQADSMTQSIRSNMADVVAHPEYAQWNQGQRAAMYYQAVNRSAASQGCSA